ncbi:MAG: hypothetical protein HC936_00270 [Leptolyngbyaceae cyanobacterium SU_3_3]|nr:hypothetical protein [Leptolyngbyaceae cyanobacterium SU_3_3]
MCSHPSLLKAEASETVSPVVRSLAGCAFVKGVGLSGKQWYQKDRRSWQRLGLADGVQSPGSKRTYPSAPTRGCGFPVKQ